MFSTEETEEKEYNGLLIAIEKGNIEIINLFLSNQNIDINTKFLCKKSYIDNDKGHFNFYRWEEEITALTKSIKSNKLEIIQLLLSQLKINTAIKLNEDYWMLQYIEDDEEFQLHEWSAAERCEIIENAYIEQYYMNGNVDRYYNHELKFQKEAFHIAIHEGNIKVIQLFLSRPELNIDSGINYSLKMHEKPLNNNENIDDVEETQDDDMPTYNFVTVNGHETVLHMALFMKGNNNEIFKLLFSRSKCDINEKSINCIGLIRAYFIDNDCKSALEIALNDQTTYDIAKLILSHPKIDTNIIKLEQKMKVKDDSLRNLLLGKNDKS